jgi:hypothetical protein
MLNFQLNYAVDGSSAAVPRCLFDAADELSSLCDDVWGSDDGTQVFGAEAEYNDMLAAPESFVWESELWPPTDSAFTATTAVRRASIFDLDPAACLRDCSSNAPPGDTFAAFLETVNSGGSLTLQGASRTYEYEGDEFQLQAMGLVM